MFNLIVIFILIAIITLTVVGYIFILQWVYTDAKAHGMSPWLWIVIIILTFGNFIGLIIYAIVRSLQEKKVTGTVCNRCRAVVPFTANFCPNCGLSLHSYERVIQEKPSNRLLVIGLNLVITCIMVVMIFFLLNFFSSSHSKVGFSRNGDAWNIEVKRRNINEEYHFSIENTDDFILYSSDFSKGIIRIELYDVTGQFVNSLLPNTTDTLKNLPVGQHYKILIKANNATGTFSLNKNAPLGHY